MERRNGNSDKVARVSRITRVVAVIVLKGGAGKTTISLNLGKAFYRSGWDVELMDADHGQSSLMTWAELASEKQPPVVQPILSELEETLDRSEAHLTIIDGPPRLDADARSILRASDLALLPVVPGIFDIAALKQTLSVIQEVQKERTERGASPLLVQAVLNRWKPQIRLAQDSQKALEEAKVEMVPTSIGDRTIFGKSASQGLSAIDVEPSGPAAKEIFGLANHLLKILQLEAEECES